MGVQADSSKKMLTFWGLPARSWTHGLASSQVLLSASRPALPRRLMSWSGFATSLVLKTQPGSWVSGVMELVAASHETWATFGEG